MSRKTRICLLAVRVIAVVLLGPKWRLHYFAHLDEIAPEHGVFVGRGRRLGAVGNTGNTAGKSPHLHYAIISMMPRPWAFSSKTQGWKQVFFLVPDAVLRASP